jgi:hypothetical protein
MVEDTYFSMGCDNDCKELSLDLIWVLGSSSEDTSGPLYLLDYGYLSKCLAKDLLECGTVCIVLRIVL